ncbi:MAG: hypothetical protein ABJA18_00345 [bacterium]
MSRYGHVKVRTTASLLRGQDELEEKKFLGGFKRFRLMLTLGLAVLSAAALIDVNFSQLRAFERGKVLEAAIHRYFQEILAITEKKINKKAYTMAEELRDLFPSPDIDAAEKEKKLRSDVPQAHRPQPSRDSACRKEPQVLEICSCKFSWIDQSKIICKMQGNGDGLLG